jgi:hypothetical protein
VASRAPDRWDGVQQWQELGDVVPVATRERDGERGSATVDEQVVFGAGTARSTGEGPTSSGEVRGRLLA